MTTRVSEPSRLFASCHQHQLTYSQYNFLYSTFALLRLRWEILYPVSIHRVYARACLDAWQMRRQHTTPSLSAPKMRGQSLSPLRYSVRWHSLSQSSVLRELSYNSVEVCWCCFQQLITVFIHYKQVVRGWCFKPFETGMNPSPCFSTAASNAYQIPSK